MPAGWPNLLKTLEIPHYKHKINTKRRPARLARKRCTADDNTD